LDVGAGCKELKTSAQKIMNPTEISITPREKEVMLFLAHGFSSRKIALEMGISFHTWPNGKTGDWNRKLI
jgi:DNA-binding NarL/FixJ family response regulator